MGVKFTVNRKDTTIILLVGRWKTLKECKANLTNCKICITFVTK